MTGKQFTFRKVGHAFAVIGYIYKWHNEYHGPVDLDLTPSEGCSSLEIDECPVCKYYYEMQSM